MSAITTPPQPRGGLRVRRDLRASIVDGAAFGGMVGLGETYLPAFALAVGLSEFSAGMVGSAPLLAGGIMQLVSPRAIRWFGSHRRWVSACAMVQALSFVPLVIGACLGSMSAWAVLSVAAWYWAAGLATGPAWNTWIGTLVPPPIRARFFAARTRISQAAVCLGFVGGGALLHFAPNPAQQLRAFAVLFGMAAACRLLSAWSLWLHSEPTPLPARMKSIPWPLVLHHLRHSSGGRLLVYLVSVQSAVQMAGPFFTPFMLKKLHLSYGQLVALLALAFLAKALSMPLWGRVVHGIGAARLMWIGGIGITPVAAGWLLSQSIIWLGVLQVVGGIAWAAYELAFFLLFFESIPEEERTSVLTIYNLLNSAAWVGGALAGGLVLATLGADYQAYLIVFGLSSLARCFTLLLLARVPRMTAPGHQLGVRTLSVRPGATGLDAPVLPSLPDQAPEETA